VSSSNTSVALSAAMPQCRLACGRCSAACAWLTMITMVVLTRVSEARAVGDQRPSAHERMVHFSMLDVNAFSLWTECDRTRLPSNKHGAALWFFDRLKEHRWRVPLSDTRAKVVVVPALIDWYSRGKCGPVTADARHVHLDNMVGVVMAADNATRSKPHLIVAEDWKS
jgi:hypothetical protein